MNLGRNLSCVAFFLAAAAAGPALAQAAGTPVIDASGAAVGTVVAVEGDQLLIKTDKHQVKLPKASFTAANGKLLFGLSQAQLNAEIDKNVAAAQAKLAPGTSVKGADGKPLGAIATIDQEFATIKLQSGKSIRVPRSGLAADGEGAVVGITASEAEAQASAGAAPAPAPAS